MLNSVNNAANNRLLLLGAEDYAVCVILYKIVHFVV